MFFCCQSDRHKGSSIRESFALQGEEEFGPNVGHFPEIPLSYDDLKKQLRGGLMADARIYWWPYLPRILPNTFISTYPNIKDSAVKRYNWAKEKLQLKSHSSVDSRRYSDEELIKDERTHDIMSLLMDQYVLEEPGLIKTFVMILVRIIPSADVCFSTCCDVLARPDWYISPNAVNHRLKLYAFTELVKKYLPKQAAQLEAIGGLQEECLNLLFVEYFFTLLPTPDVARIMDCFLLEGSKIIHRFGLGIIYMYRSVLDFATSGKDFWDTVRIRSHQGLVFEDLYQQAFNIGRSALSILSGRLSLSRAFVGHYEGQARLSLGEALTRPLNLGFVSRHKSNMLEKISRILDEQSAARLKMFIPESYLFDGFSLVFSTHRDGWNIDTLYRKTVAMSPCIVLVRSLQARVVIGAFLPVCMSPPSSVVRGTGLTFVCRLNGELAACYRWNAKGEAEDRATVHQFAMCREDCIIFGGSAEHATNAIRIDAELKTCYCGPSDTFNNPALAPEEPVQPFIIEELEVLCGKSSASRMMSDEGYMRSVWTSMDDAEDDDMMIRSYSHNAASSKRNKHSFITFDRTYSH